jgi:hypothetical protein
MFFARIVVLFLVILWPWPGQSDELNEAYRQGQKFYEAGHYEKAIPYFRDVLKLVERQDAGANSPPPDADDRSSVRSAYQPVKEEAPAPTYFTACRAENGMWEIVSISASDNK